MALDGGPRPFPCGPGLGPDFALCSRLPLCAPYSLGDPKDAGDTKYQHDRSPIYFVDKMVKPLLVVQGEKDARVKADQSERIVKALQDRKVPVHYLFLAGEGHGFTKNENNLKASLETDRFLDHYVFGDTTIAVE